MGICLSRTERWQPGTEKPVATRHRGQSSPQSNLVSYMCVPPDHRKWNEVPAVDDVSKRSLSWRVSQIVTKILRHRGSHREDDGAIDWNNIGTYVMSRLRTRERLEGHIRNGCILFMSIVHFTSHAITRAIFSRVWLKLRWQCLFVCGVSKTFIISRARHVPHVA